MKELLGIVPPNDSVGCLQDIHWPDGAWGYFPTYTLGALAAAQLFAAARKAVPGLMEFDRQGRFRAVAGVAAGKCARQGLARRHRHDPVTGHRRAARHRGLQGASGKPLPVGVRGTMLDLRPNCECCDKDLPNGASDALICTYECTFCADWRERAAGRPVPQLRRRPGQAADPPRAHAGQASRPRPNAFEKDHAACKQVAYSRERSPCALHQHPSRLRQETGSPAPLGFEERHARGPRARRRSLFAGRVAALLQGRDRGARRASPIGEVAFRVMRPFVGTAFDEMTFRRLIAEAYASFECRKWRR